MSNMIRLGKFYVPTKMIESKEVQESLMKIEFVPVKVEQRYERNSFMMMGFSNVFELIDRTNIAPEYNLIISDDKPIRAEKV